MQEYNSSQVTKTLKTIAEVLHKHNINYWFMGSILPTAIHGSLYRYINDFDILVDKSKVNIVIQELEIVGFRRKKRNIYRFSERLDLYVFLHDELLETSFFALDIKDKESILESGPFKITINNDVIKKSSYSFQGIKFSGIPPSASYSIALLSKNNPKRKIELEIYTKKKIEPQKKDYLICTFSILEVIG